jgi:ferredoxin-NADP reductase
MVRQYSLCGNPADRRVYRLGVLLDPASRGGSAAIHTRFHTGSRIKISPPRNLFPLAADARHSVLTGGGIGFTPLIAMAHHLEGAGRLHPDYCAKAHDKAAFLTELNEAGFRDRVHLHFDDGPRPQRFDRARDIPQPADDVHLYVCGPDGFVAWIIAEARRFGYREPHSHRGYFSISRPPATVRVRHSTWCFRAATGASPSVRKARSLRRWRTPASRLRRSCEEGICGTCLCTVLAGVPDHRDVYLTDEEKAANDQMLLCCSRSKTPQLVLDL